MSAPTISYPLQVGLDLPDAFPRDVESLVPHPPLGSLAVDQSIVHVLFAVPFPHGHDVLVER